MTQPKIDHLEAVHDYSITQATIAGVACYRFEVRAGDVQPWDVGNIGPNNKANERAEISYAPAPGDQKYLGPYDVRADTGKVTYDIDYRFAAGFPPHVSANHEWAVITQFHPQDKDPDPFQGFGGCSVHDGQITIDKPDGQGNYFVRIPIVPETWIKLRMVVNWTDTPAGYVKIIDRATGALLGRYDGKTIAGNGQFKYGPKQGYYRAGGLPTGIVYQSSPGGPLIDITPGDLSEQAPTPAPAKKKNDAPFDPSKDSVQPNDGAAALEAIRDQLLALKDPRVQPQIDLANKLLDAGAWTP